MTESLTNGQIDKLGIVIRDGDMGDAEWLVFESLRRRCNEVEQAIDVEIREVISEKDIDITPRFKNIETIREKLRRSPIRLSQMRDIVGFRIVAPGGRLRQDEIAARLCFRFQSHKVKTIDRRSNPIHGYRALHLEVEFDGMDIEIQIRTRLQHEWAEAFERLADICGRGIRYGEPLEYNHLEPHLHKLLVSLHLELVKLADLFGHYETHEFLHEARTVVQSEELLSQARSVSLDRIKNVNLLLVEIRKSLG